jgi:hypothetical protein
MSLSDSLLFSRGPRGAAGLDLTALLELSAPRAWYLATSLPAIVSTRRAD